VTAVVVNLQSGLTEDMADLAQQTAVLFFERAGVACCGTVLVLVKGHKPGRLSMLQSGTSYVSV
jgi:hypothetical protein